MAINGGTTRKVKAFDKAGNQTSTLLFRRRNKECWCTIRTKLKKHWHIELISVRDVIGVSTFHSIFYFCIFPLEYSSLIQLCYLDRLRDHYQSKSRYLKNLPGALGINKTTTFFAALLDHAVLVVLQVAWLARMAISQPSRITKLYLLNSCTTNQAITLAFKTSWNNRLLSKIATKEVW